MRFTFQAIYRTYVNGKVETEQSEEVETKSLQTCTACRSVIVGGNYQHCLCGAALAFVETSSKVL